MAENKVIIELTSEQQKQIKETTGKSVTKLSINPAASSTLSEKDLDNVSGGPIYIEHTNV